jgi:hypothetical protein
MRSSLPGLLAGLLLAPSLLGADPGGVVSPAAGEKLLSAGLVEVRWEALPEGAEEGELLLSLDGGATFPLRIGPRLDPSARSAWWVVPALPAGAARLRLRVGIEGREIECEPSGLFEIVTRPGATQVSFLLRDDEWWVADETLPLSRLGSPRTFLPWDDALSLSALFEDPDDPCETSAEREAHGTPTFPEGLTPGRKVPSASVPLSIPRRE